VIDSSRVFPGPFSYYMVEKKWHRFAFDASALPRARLSRASAYFVDGLSIFIFFFTHYHHIWRIFRLLFSSSGHIHDPQDMFPLSDEACLSASVPKSFKLFICSPCLFSKNVAAYFKPRHCSVDAPLYCNSDLDEPMRGDPTSRVLNHQLPGQNCPIVLH